MESVRQSSRSSIAKDMETHDKYMGKLPPPSPMTKVRFTTVVEFDKACTSGIDNRLMPRYPSGMYDVSVSQHGAS